ncbi:hypothetical protein JSQ81_06395 [Sporosarcina sp. Marseille-Q4063]|uniref:hypothetical protein n=1 Tax=Sporosarcina sp. Marseille-Q4063 TaxID=2810514 RepID=UPI001BAF4B6E|nr:hypothetical protein [Sporosarcina sp. Marseille-Q4063]QUW23188.1 hypothetical protein JSQ81_06395 [Sporosarcina sp. Marseille-Q4063]
MKKALTGLIMGLSFTIISFLSSLTLFLICFYVLEVRLYSWSGIPYMDVVIYYGYMIIVLGFFFSIIVPWYINKAYPNDLFKSVLFISLISSIVFVVSSWFIVDTYSNSYFSINKILPLRTERYNLPAYNIGLSYFVIIGVYLIFTPVLIVLVRDSLWQNKRKNI